MDDGMIAVGDEQEAHVAVPDQTQQPKKRGRKLAEFALQVKTEFEDGAGWQTVETAKGFSKDNPVGKLEKLAEAKGAGLYQVVEIKSWLTVKTEQVTKTVVERA